MTSTLSDVDHFTNETKNNINIKNKNLGDVFELLKVKENLQNIQEKKQNIVLELDVVEESLRMLEKQEMPRDADMKKVRKAQEEWNNLQKLSQVVEREIQNPVKAESEKARADILKFEESLKDYYVQMKKESFYIYKTGVEEATSRLDSVKEDIKKFEEQITNYDYFSKMFSFPEAIGPATKNLDQIKSEVNAITNLWTHIKNCEQRFTEYKIKKWADVNTMDMEEEVKKMRKDLMDLKGVDKRCLAFTGISEEIKRWQTFLPLLGELKNPAMETTDRRHWKKLKDLVKK